MSDAYEDILIDRVGTEGRVARITLNRPTKLNALLPRTLGELDRALHDLEADQSARVIILRGAGKAFCVGYDLVDGDIAISPRNPNSKFQKTAADGRPLPLNYAAGLQAGTDIQMYFWRMGKITIAETHGYCLAGGMEFAMMADLVTTSDDCLLGHPGHRSIGVARNGMILPLIMGMRKAKELFYTCDTVTGAEAAKLEIVNYSWPADQLENRTIQFADRIANQSSDFLAGLKLAANGFYENMGIYSSVHRSTQLDAAVQNSESSYVWWKKLKDEGLRSAIEWRDDLYKNKDYAG
jgi:enoyl-CoA hydratase